MDTREKWVSVKGRQSQEYSGSCGGGSGPQAKASYLTGLASQPARAVEASGGKSETREQKMESL